MEKHNIHKHKVRGVSFDVSGIFIEPALLDISEKISYHFDNGTSLGK